MSLVGHLRHWRYAAELARRKALYESITTDAARQERQIQLFNAEWQRLLKLNSYAQDLRRCGAPESFRDLAEFRASIPVMNRSQARRLASSMQNSGPPANFKRITGGSTSEPLHMPAWKSEFRHTSPNIWLGRSWYGIGAHSRVFFIWGHSHQLGSGIQRSLNKLRVKLTDSVLGFERFPAYDLSPEAMRRAAERILAFRPHCVTGYSVALDTFARANRSRPELGRAGVQLVVPTAEGLPGPDSAACLSGLFQCPVAMEYGSVECSVLAYMHPHGGYKVFWETYLIEAEAEPVGGLVRKLFVTSLYPRFFPLLRYELGDQIELSPSEARCPGSLASFRHVVGRCDDEVVLPDGTRHHSQVFTNTVRLSQAVLAYQVVQSPRRCVVRVTGNGTIPEHELSAIRQRLAKAHPSLAVVEIEQTPSLHQSVAGKTPMVIREGGQAA
jgi:phenylacetate-coenzyme A ligase PaaK-like adenylate-forming protein